MRVWIGSQSIATVKLHGEALCELCDLPNGSSNINKSLSQALERDVELVCAASGSSFGNLSTKGGHLLILG